MYVHLVHHHDEHSFVHDNHTCHPFHHVAHVIVVLELLLLTMVIYSSHASFVVVVFSFVAPIMIYFPSKV
jgi:hypothetical protein